MNFSILLSNNNRSKAYLQNLINKGYVPAAAIVLEGGATLRPENTQTDLQKAGAGTMAVLKGSNDAGVFFNEGEHVSDTLKDSSIPVTVLDTMDVNSEAVVEAVGNVSGDYIVYSGPGGTILKKDVLGQGKDFIHTHPGWLPTYRGSTTVYYSLLVDKTVSCSVFLMREALDAGPLLYRKRFEITDTAMDLDRVLDPAIRTSALLDFFDNSERLLADQVSQDTQQGNTFYIIHPVLKHLAILRAGNND